MDDFGIKLEKDILFTLDRIRAYERNKAIDEFCNALCSNGAIADFMKDYIIEKGKEFKQCHISQ